MKFIEVKEKIENGVKWADLGLKVNIYVPIGKKYGMAEQVLDDVIVNKDGFYTINRLNYDLALCAIIYELYTDIEHEDEFTDIMLDVFLQYKFYKWLGAQTNGDCFEFESIMKTVVLDEIRKLNSSPMNFNIEELKTLIENPKVTKILEWTGKEESKKVTRQMVDNGDDK